MSYDDKIDKMNWKDECSWIVISFISGLLLSLIYFYFDRFQGFNQIAVTFCCSIGFYFLSILLRIQNHRGKVLTGKTAFKENILKCVFPAIGLIVGLFVMLF